MSVLQSRPESQLAKKWEIVESSVGSILQKKDLRYSYQSIHQAIYTLSQANEGDAVFTALSRIFKECSENICTRLRSFTEKWFEEYLICSKDYLLRTALVERVLSYYNENYMVALRDTSLTWLASTILEVTIFSDPVAKDRLCENAKQAYHLDVSSSKKALHSLVSRPFGTPGSNIASVFINAFEEEAIKSLTDEKETGKYANVTDYFKWFEAVRERELDRFSPLNSGDYANFFTEFVDKLGQLLCGALGTEDTDILETHLRAGVPSLVRSGNVEALGSIMASLSSLVDHGAPKISETMEYVADELRKEASEIMDEVSATPSKSFVPEFLQLMQKCRLIYTRIPELAQNQKTALPSVLVLSKPLIKHLMFYFFDSMGTAQFPAELLDDMTDVYQLFTDKDAFEVPFLHVFAAVILKPSGPSVKQLCAFIDTFKGRISAEGNSTLRFERVLNDLKQTEGINEKFRKKKKELPVEFRVNVLSAGAWPLTRDVPLKVLPEMQTCIRQFKDYYNSHTKERLLNFNLATGTVSFDYTYNGERCCISAHTTFLHSILALNSDKVFAPGSVGLSSGLDTAETESQLNCLVHLHLCNKNGKYYSFNKNFTPQSSTMWISNLPTEGKTVQKTPIKRKAERNEFDVSIDAAIVKTLKTEKRLNFSTIYQRVIARLSPSFEPSHYDVKRRIEILVGKEFITRDAKDFFEFLQ